MHKSTWLFAVAAVVLLLSASGYAQQDSQSPPLGDVAREDQARRDHLAGQARASKVYTNDDFPTAPNPISPAPTQSTETDSKLPEPPTTTAQPVVEAPADEEENRADSDRRGVREEDHDVIVVPAGTRIQADMGSSYPTTEPWKGQLVMPVCVGFTTAIHEGAEVTFVAAPSYQDDDGTPWGWMVELIAIKVGEDTYDIQTSPVLAGTDHEVTFVLKEPLTIYR